MGALFDRPRPRMKGFAKQASAATCAGIIILMTSCRDGSAPESVSPAGSTTSTSPSGDRCTRYPPPFEASYLPPGFKHKLRTGAGLFKGTDYPTEGLLGHYRGKKKTIHINFEVKGGPLPYEPATPKPLRVLGNPGRIGTIEGGFSVEFGFRSCDFRMDTYGITREQTVHVAQGLRRR